MRLPRPARYFPIERGLYEVAPGLRNLDGPVFQFDELFPRFRANKLRARVARLSRHYARKDLSAEVDRAVCLSLVSRFVAEGRAADGAPLFAHKARADGGGRLECRLTGELLEWDAAMRLAPRPTGYVDLFDALCSQAAEDVAVMSTEGERNWLSAIHLCSPEHWGAEEKIGLNFFDMHKPVPGIERLNRAHAAFVDAMVNKGPYERYVWGFVPDDELNHHPEVVRDRSVGRWPAPLDLDRPRSCFLRVERQTLHGLPEARAAIFTIRISFVDGHEIRANPKERALLRSGLLSMTPESRVYKRVADQMDAIIAWLDAGT